MAVLTIGRTQFDVDAVLFDKDGTLLNFGDLWTGWFEALLDRVEQCIPATVRLDRDTLRQWVGVEPTTGLWDPTGPLTIGSIDDIAAIVGLHLYQQNIPWNDSTQWIGESLEFLQEGFDWANNVTPVGGLLRFLTSCHQADIKMAVVTSDNTVSASRQLEHLGVHGFFPVILGHDLVVRGKPFPDMALQACRQLQVAPERTLIFGDSNGDMAMGRAAGLSAGVGVCAGPHLSGDHLGLAAAFIRHYDEVQVTAIPASGL
ncbi:HAD family hydrolase [Nitrincola alkalilacustris]|uniref:HAD family hydrolase n=1 Tax=Nitrincola alkalilacustris TaxID=1571224 RepID=UPI00124F3DF4|nr:HAD family hydrolase [Nitrincola alkalilacustris]